VKAWVRPLGGLRWLDPRSGRIVHVRPTKGWICANSIVLGPILSRCTLIVRERLCLLVLSLNLRMHWQWGLHTAVMVRRSRKSHMMVPQPHPLDCRQDLHVFLNRVTRRTKGSYWKHNLHWRWNLLMRRFLFNHLPELLLLLGFSVRKQRGLWIGLRELPKRGKVRLAQSFPVRFCAWIRRLNLLLCIYLRMPYLLLEAVIQVGAFALSDGFNFLWSSSSSIGCIILLLNNSTNIISNTCMTLRGLTQRCGLSGLRMMRALV
jgi:hypothetical protein